MRTQRNWWLLVAALAFVTFVLGASGFRAIDIGQSLADDAYLSMQLFVLESGAIPDPVPWQLEIARIVAPVVAAFVTVGLIRELISALRSQEFFLASRGGHVIVCGLGRKGARLALGYAERGEHVVAIEPVESRAERIEELRSAGVRILHGSATDRGTLRRAGIGSASRMIVTCGADRTDAQVAALAHELLSAEESIREAGRTPLKLFVHLVDRELKQRLTPLLDRRAEHLDVTVFNVYEAAAEALVGRPPLAASGNQSAATRVMLIGFGELAESLVIALAGKWSLEEGQAVGPTDGVGRRSLTVVDRDPTKKLEALASHHPQVLAIKSRPVALDIAGVEFEEGEDLRQLSEDLDAVVICLNDEVLSVVTALTVADILQGEGYQDLPIMMRVESADQGLPALMKAEDTPAHRNVVPVSVLDESCAPESLDRFEALGRAVRVSYDAETDYLVILRPGEVDDQLDTQGGDENQVAEGVWELRRGGDGPIIGVVVQPLSSWRPDPSLGAEWTGPRFDCTAIGVREATPGELIATARERLGGRSTRDVELFGEARGGHPDQDEEAALWRRLLAAGDPKAHYGLGYTLLDQGEFEEAKLHLRLYTRLAPKNAWAWCWLGKAAQASGDIQSAGKAYRRAQKVEAETGVKTDAPELLRALEAGER